MNLTTPSSRLKQLIIRSQKTYDQIAFEIGYRDKSTINWILKDPQGRLSIQKAELLAKSLNVSLIKIVRTISTN